MSHAVFGGNVSTATHYFGGYGAKHPYDILPPIFLRGCMRRRMVGYDRSWSLRIGSSAKGAC